MADLTVSIGIILTVLLLTSFVKIVTSLTIFRFGIGLHGSGFGLVILAVSLALSLLIMGPQLKNLGGVNALFTGKLAKNVDYEKEFRPFLEKNSDPEIKGRLMKFTPRKEESEAAENAKREAADSSGSFELMIASFLLTELKEAFQIGAIILIPFLVLDLLVVNILVLLGVNHFNPDLASIPLKIMLFFAVDGWTLLTEKLLRTYF